MQKSQCLLFVFKRSYICCIIYLFILYILYKTTPQTIFKIRFLKQIFLFKRSFWFFFFLKNIYIYFKFCNSGALLLFEDGFVLYFSFLFHFCFSVFLGFFFSIFQVAAMGHHRNVIKFFFPSRFFINLEEWNVDASKRIYLHVIS